MDRTKIVQAALSAPPDSIRRVMTSGIRAEDSELYIVEVHDIYDEVYRYSDKEHCLLRSIAGFDQDINLNVNQGKISGRPQCGWHEVIWQGNSLEFVEVQIHEGYRRIPFVLLMSKKPETVRSFLVALERFSSDIDRAVLVFQDGCWKYDEALFQDIQNSTFDNIVLPGGMAGQIRDDIQQWLDSREMYERHGVPWKRGLILVGPPGNGKTHMIKALANHFDLSTLYVRGFSAEYHSDAQNISSVFKKARACAPSMLVLEDLDTLVNAENRSHFLNELDGFARNTGILAVASANNPARLDPALVNRPSRFDRRYAFNLPEAAERRRYLQFFTSSLEPGLRLSDADAAAIGADTDGFSYAYLKELILSTMMSWVSAPASSFGEAMRKNVASLREQMTIDPEPTPPAKPEDPQAKMMRAMKKRAAGR